jgi:hypothetical protein
VPDKDILATEAGYGQPYTMVLLTVR